MHRVYNIRITYTGYIFKNNKQETSAAINTRVWQYNNFLRRSSRILLLATPREPSSDTVTTTIATITTTHPRVHTVSTVSTTYIHIIYIYNTYSTLIKGISRPFAGRYNNICTYILLYSSRRAARWVYIGRCVYKYTAIQHVCIYI